MGNDNQRFEDVAEQVKASEEKKKKLDRRSAPSQKKELDIDSILAMNRGFGDFGFEGLGYLPGAREFPEIENTMKKNIIGYLSTILSVGLPFSKEVSKDTLKAFEYFVEQYNSGEFLADLKNTSFLFVPTERGIFAKDGKYAASYYELPSSDTPNKKYIIYFALMPSNVSYYNTDELTVMALHNYVLLYLAGNGFSKEGISELASALHKGLSMVLFSKLNTVDDKFNRVKNTIVSGKPLYDTEKGIKKVGNKTVRLMEGNIVSLDVDAIVNGSNPGLLFGIGVGSAILRYGGDSIAKEASAIVKRQGNLRPGDAVVTGSGRLKAKHVIHAAVSNEYLEPDLAVIKQATKNSLKLADELGLKTIAFPAFGTGTIGVPYEQSARVMLEVIEEHLKGNTSLEEVSIVYYGQDGYEAALAVMPKEETQDSNGTMFSLDKAEQEEEMIARTSGNPTEARADSYKKTNKDAVKDWAKIEQEFKVLIDAASSQDEVKRLYRKMANEVHPDKNPTDIQNSERVFKDLYIYVEKKLAKDFGVKAPKGKDTKEDNGFSWGWVGDWAWAASAYPEDNENVMGEAIRALEKRASRVTKGGKDSLEPIAQALSSIAAKLSVKDIGDLLNISYKKEFGKALMEKMQKDGSYSSITEDLLWEARPLLERLYSARILRQGEIVHIRKGNELIRTVILEPMTKDSPKLKAIMVTAPFGLFIMDLPNKVFEIDASEIVSLAFDLEREPVQKGWDINIGDQLEMNLTEDVFIKGKTTLTVIAAYGGGYTMIANRRIHNNLENYSGYGLAWGKWGATDALKNGEIRKVIPLLKASFEEEQAVIQAIPTRLNSVGTSL